MRKYNMCSDPWVFKEFFIKPPAEPKTNIVLGLDLGTNCGYSYCYIKEKQLVAPENIEMHIGQWDLSAGSYDSGALRFVRLRQFLSILKPDINCF